MSSEADSTEALRLVEQIYQECRSHPSGLTDKAKTAMMGLNWILSDSDSSDLQTLAEKLLESQGDPIQVATSLGKMKRILKGKEPSDKQQQVPPESGSSMVSPEKEATQIQVQATSEPMPLESKSSKVSHDPPKQYPWVIRDIKTPTPEIINVMTETLRKTTSAWEDTELVNGTVDPLNLEVNLLVVKYGGGRCGILFRHLLLYLQIKYEVFVTWAYNLDRQPNRKLIPLLLPLEDPDLKDKKTVTRMKQAVEFRRKTGIEVIKLSEAQLTMTEKSQLAMIDKYMLPGSAAKNMEKSKVAILPLQGTTIEQAQAYPNVNCIVKGTQETVALGDYIHKMAMNEIWKEFIPSKTPLMLPSVVLSPQAVKKKSASPQQKKKSAKQPLRRLQIPQHRLKVTNPFINEFFTEFCTVKVSEDAAKWLVENMLPIQDDRDARLIEAWEQKKEVTHEELHRHRRHKDEEHCDHRYVKVQCRHKQLLRACEGDDCEGCKQECYHDVCPIMKCKTCPVVMKNVYYAMRKINPWNREEATWKKESVKDIRDIHTHSVTAKHATMHKKLVTVRNLCEFYTIAVHDLLGDTEFGDSQTTVVSLCLSSWFFRIVIRFYDTIIDENKVETKNRQVADIVHFMEGSITTFLDSCSQVSQNLKDTLNKRLEESIKKINVFKTKCQGPGKQVQDQMSLKLPATHSGRAPPLSRLADAHAFLRKNLWNKVCKGRGPDDSIPVGQKVNESIELGQKILVLAFAKNLMGARSGMLSHMAFGKNIRTIGSLIPDSIDHQYTGPDKEKHGLAYAKAFGLEFIRQMKDRVHKEERFEIPYYVCLLSLGWSWYGYKNSHRNARIVPFHRIMSMEIITFAALIVFIRPECQVESSQKAAEFIQYQQENGFDVSKAYKWIHQEKIDFVGMVSEELKQGDKVGWIRLFYTSENDFRYGSHAAHINMSPETQKIEDNAARKITQLFRTAMQEFIEDGDVVLDELYDGFFGSKDDVFGSKQVRKKVGAKYSQRGVRNATSDFLSSVFPDMPEDVKRMLVEQTLMHTLETHTNVYDKDMKYMRCARLRDWLDRGVPMKEFHSVMKETEAQMKINDTFTLRDFEVDLDVDAQKAADPPKQTRPKKQKEKKDPPKPTYQKKRGEEEMDIIAQYLPGAEPHASSLCHIQNSAQRYLMGRFSGSQLKLWAENEDETIHLLSGENMHALLEDCHLKLDCSGISAWDNVTHLRTVKGNTVSWNKKRVRRRVG